MNYVVFLKSPSGKVQIIGNPEGKSFTNEKIAENWANKYRTAYPRLEVLVFPVTSLSIDTVPL